MLRPRIIPCLLIHDKGLVKTTKFSDPVYVGDPLNAVKIFNEKEADEIVILDIDCSSKNRRPDMKLLEQLALECRMPMCYGGGIKTVEQAKDIISLGIEKIAISSAAIENPRLVSDIANAIGNQSVVVVLDVKKKSFSSSYEVWTYNGKKNTKISPLEFSKQLEEFGVGEIVINSIENDGMMKGFNLDLVNEIYNSVNVPLTVLGGAGSLDDIKAVVDKFGIIGVAAGSLFVFKGKLKAVLINYPSVEFKDSLVDSRKSL
ncbi:imidazole glycerol phosphate synthase subunit HisF [Leptospira sp. 201903075]|uniref:AglZ/HisF2 family acetamidino modification protein n=1 Tax=Leptospira chreensis TaxID=2810035 RepID=UPI001964A677|nr:AglZ/HisF2 family acetamidino modification protein [Leptospira chreensis]MBM9589041.1 imidazole glycerol phosphate synthase subunit HisF [Leptospira chreensis]